jgi:hypothetical protein
MGHWPILLAQEVSKVGDGVVRVSDEKVLRLLAIVFLAVDIRQDGGYLPVWHNSLSASEFKFAPTSIIGLPPSSFAMTSTLPSAVYAAIELFELPKAMPIATRSPGSGPGVAAPVSDISTGGSGSAVRDSVRKNPGIGRREGQAAVGEQESFAGWIDCHEISCANDSRIPATFHPTRPHHSTR